MRAFVASALLLAALPARGEEALPPQLVGISIEDKVGAVLPRDVRLRDHAGREVVLGDFLDGRRPLVMVLAYYRCPMLCTLVLNGLTRGLKDLDWNLGDQYRVLVVSIDPTETVELAGEKRKGYVAEYGRPVADERAWTFTVGEESEVRRLAAAIGFGYRWDPATKQFAHAAGAFVVTPGGVLARTMWGVVFPGKDLKLAVVEAAEGKVGGAWDKALLFCFRYDAAQGGYVLAARRVMMAGGALTILVLGGFLVGMWVRERRAPTISRSA